MDKVKLLLALCLLATQAEAACENGWINESNFTCLKVSAVEHSNYGLELCEAHTGDCTAYNSSQHLPLNVTLDYILKITPEHIEDSRDLSNYFTSSNALQGLLLLLLVVFVIVFLLKVILNVR